MLKKQYIPIKITQVYDQGQVMNRDFRVKQVVCANYITSFIDLEDNLWMTGNDDDLNIESKIPIKVRNIKVNKVAAGLNHMVMISYYN